MRIRSPRGGLLLDGVLVLAIVLIGAYALNRLGVSFSELVQGAQHFFGM